MQASTPATIRPTGITGAYVAAVHDYLGRELHHETTDEYKLSAGIIGELD